MDEGRSQLDQRTVEVGHRTGAQRRIAVDQVRTGAECRQCTDEAGGGPGEAGVQRRRSGEEPAPGAVDLDLVAVDRAADPQRAERVEHRRGVVAVGDAVQDAAARRQRSTDEGAIGDALRTRDAVEGDLQRRVERLDPPHAHPSRSTAGR